MTPDPLRANPTAALIRPTKGVSDDKHYVIYLKALLTMRGKAEPQAEILALDVLAWLAESPADLTDFMTLSGLEPAGLRERASDPQLLAGVLDFILGRETLLQRFCEMRSLEPAAIHRARAALSAHPTRDGQCG